MSETDSRGETRIVPVCLHTVRTEDLGQSPAESPRISSRLLESTRGPPSPAIIETTEFTGNLINDHSSITKHGR